jgi:carbon storage regulator CsrA
MDLASRAERSVNLWLIRQRPEPVTEYAFVSKKGENMLVLSRGQNDKVVFPTLGISVEIIRVAGKKVRLGIEAPEEIPVHRHEVCERIQAKAKAGEEDEQVLKFPDAKNSYMARLNHDTRNRLNSAALGLHLLHRKLENGDLSDVESTIFTIFNELKGIETLLEQPTKASADTQAEVHRRALVVEDNDNERELLAGYLRVSGFDVDTAADGLQAMVRLTQNAPDVVLLDMRMPRFDGRKTVAAIRNNPDYRGLKLFAVSGTKPEEMNVALGPNGVDRWFTKPLDPKTLIDALHDELHTERILA